ncbi:MAG: rhomboid family intramembrane serine protease [Succinivibrio sp.]|nr:rhomboid family intramembrane serine protease [Succinivibrio sp.]
MAGSEELNYPYLICLLPREQALTFADYLIGQGIRAAAFPGSGRAWQVKAAAESAVPAAKRELARFIQSPEGTEFQKASWERDEPAAAPREVKPKFLATLNWDPLSFTSLIELICLIVFAAQFLLPQVMERYLSLGHGSITGPLDYYRLLTPAFLHFGIFHFAFNLVMWEALARPVERFRGKARLSALFFCVVLLSNVLQYLFTPSNTIFGGLSGAVYGVIGYSAVLSRRADLPAGYAFPRGLMAVSVIFIALGFVLGGIANFCHLGGLLIGCLWGLYDYKYARFGRAY